MSETLDNAEEKVLRALIDLQKPHPFFAHLLMQLKVEELPRGATMPNGQNMTAGVNAKGELIYAPEFIDGLKQEQIMGTMCHEALHVGLLHPLRYTPSMNKDIANIAMDVVVNMIVRKANLDLPDGVVPADIYKDKSTFMLEGKNGPTEITVEKVSEKSFEEVYAEIMQQLKQDGNSPKKGCSGGCQGGLNFDQHPDESDNPMSPEEKQEQQQKWQNALASAAQHAKAQGNLPEGMQRIIDGLLKPKVSWRALLLKYLRPHLNPVDWTYQKPHRKSQALGVYMPNTLKESCEVEVLVDTSGSISAKELKEFISEIVAIAQSMQHVKMFVSFIDTRVTTRYEVDNGDIPKILAFEAKGGGGTDQEKGLDFIKENNPSIPVVIVLTDGYKIGRAHV